MTSRQRTTCACGTDTASSGKRSKREASAAPSAEEISSLAAQIKRLLTELGGGFPELNRQTIINLLNVARRLGRTADLVPFIAEKLGRRDKPIQGWGGVLEAVRNDLDLWKAAGARGPECSNAEERGYLKDRLNEYRTQSQPNFSPCDDWTAANVLRAARRNDPDASVSAVAWLTRQYMIELRVEGWGGIVTAIREGWVVKTTR